MPSKHPGRWRLPLNPFTNLLDPRRQRRHLCNRRRPALKSAARYRDESRRRVRCRRPKLYPLTMLQQNRLALMFQLRLLSSLLPLHRLRDASKYASISGFPVFRRCSCDARYGRANGEGPGANDIRPATAEFHPRDPVLPRQRPINRTSAG